MGKLRKQILYFMIPVALVMILEGLIYYSKSGLTTLSVALCTLENTIMTFIARPTISSFLAFRTMGDEYTLFERIVTYLYGATIIIAPILTTTAVLAGFQSYVLDFLYSLKLTSRDRMYVIGDGKMAANIAEKYADRYFVQYLMPSGTESKKRLPLLKKKVWAYAVDYSNMPLTLKDIKLEKAVCVVLDFKDWFSSLNGINLIFERLMQKKSGEPTPVCIVDAPVLYRDVFDSMYRGLCMKYNCPETVLAVSFVNTEEVNAAKFFEQPNLTEQPDGHHHVMIVGLGNYGTALLNELQRYFLRHGLWGTTDVFDRNVERHVNNLIYSPDNLRDKDKMDIIEPAENAKLSGRVLTPSGPLQANYYQATVGELNFTDYLIKIIEKEKFTELFFCIDDISVNFECYRLGLAMIKENRDTNMYFRVGKSSKGYFDAMELSTKNIYRLPDELPDVELFK